MYEMLAGFPPFYDEENDNPVAIYTKILNGQVSAPQLLLLLVDANLLFLQGQIPKWDGAVRQGFDQTVPDARCVAAFGQSGGADLIDRPLQYCLCFLSRAVTELTNWAHKLQLLVCIALNLCLQGGAEDVKRHRFFRGTDWVKLAAKEVAPPIIPRVNGPTDSSYFEIEELEPENSQVEKTTVAEGLFTVFN